VLNGDSRLPSRNIELKAIDPDAEHSLLTCLELAAYDAGTIWQRDTYFHAAHGRLKLREQRPGRAALIHYERPDRTRPRESRYRISPVTRARSVRETLGAALGVRVVVEKERRVFLWDFARIHLDAVEGLGSFVEFEALVDEHSDAQDAHRRVEFLVEAFRIDPQQVVARSYSDMLRAGGRVPAGISPG
jgi:adenylate cyclase, class 2